MVCDIYDHALKYYIKCKFTSFKVFDKVIYLKG